MSASDTALSADFNNLEVKSASAFNTPISGTPIPTTRLSSDTTALLEDVATKLKVPVSKKGKGIRRKRLKSSATSYRERTTLLHQLP